MGSRPCISPGQRTRADSVGRGTSESALKVWEQESCTPTLSAMWRHMWGKDAPTPCLLCKVGEMASEAWEWESWSCPSPTAALGRAGPAPQLSKTVELSLVMWVWVWEQENWPHVLLPAVLCELAGQCRRTCPGIGNEGNLAGWSVQNQGYKLVHCNIHLIYKLLEHAKGSDLWFQNCRIAMKQQDIPKVFPVKIQG